MMEQVAWLNRLIQAETIGQKEKEADPIYQAVKTQKEYADALKLGQITSSQYDEKMRQLGNTISGVSDRTADFDAEMKKLDKGRNFLAGDQYSQGRENALAKLGVTKSPAEEIRAQARELERLAGLWRTNRITSDEYRASVAKLNESAGIPKSTADQWSDFMTKRNSILGRTDLDGWQKRQGQTNALPSEIRSLFEQTRTPMEKFAEKMADINAWLGKPTGDKKADAWRDDLRQRATNQLNDQYAQEMGLGVYHRFAGAQEYGSDAARETIMRAQYGKDDVQTQVLQVQKDLVKATQDNTAALKGDTGGNVVDAGI
jgi:hypothetical protein